MKLLKKAARRRGKPDVALTDEENPWELLKGAWNGSTAGDRSSHLKQGEKFTPAISTVTSASSILAHKTLAAMYICTLEPCSSDRSHSGGPQFKLDLVPAPFELRRLSVAKGQRYWKSLNGLRLFSRQRHFKDLVLFPPAILNGTEVIAVKTSSSGHKQGALTTPILGRFACPFRRGQIHIL